MIKAQEIKEPTSCLNKADSLEPLFILRAQDALAPEIVRLWAVAADSSGAPSGKVIEANELAQEMEDWQATHGAKVPD